MSDPRDMVWFVFLINIWSESNFLLFFNKNIWCYFKEKTSNKIYKIKITHRRNYKKKSWSFLLLLINKDLQKNSMWLYFRNLWIHYILTNCNCWKHFNQCSCLFLHIPLWDLILVSMSWVTYGKEKLNFLGYLFHTDHKYNFATTERIVSKEDLRSGREEGGSGTIRKFIKRNHAGAWGKEFSNEMNIPETINTEKDNGWMTDRWAAVAQEWSQNSIQTGEIIQAWTSEEVSTMKTRKKIINENTLSKSRTGLGRSSLSDTETGQRVSSRTLSITQADRVELVLTFLLTRAETGGDLFNQTSSNPAERQSSLQKQELKGLGVSFGISLMIEQDLMGRCSLGLLDCSLHWTETEYSVELNCSPKAGDLMPFGLGTPYKICGPLINPMLF